MKGKLWWIAESPTEVARFVNTIAAGGGKILRIEHGEDGHYDIVFEVDREQAVRNDWVPSTTAENWLEEERTFSAIVESGPFHFRMDIRSDNKQLALMDARHIIEDFFGGDGCDVGNMTIWIDPAKLTIDHIRPL